MCVLITGADGLIGRHLQDELAAVGERAVCLDLGPVPAGGVFPYELGDVIDGAGLKDICRKHGVTRAVHLAAILQYGCEESPRRAQAVNIGGTANLLEVARELGFERVVFASSAAVYGPVTDPLISEDTPYSPSLGLYGASKLWGEILGSRYHTVFGVPFVALRYWGVYGPRAVKTPGVASAISSILDSIKGDVVVKGVGAGDLRHFTYVKDAARATVLALQAPLVKPRVFNIAGPEESYTSFQGFHQMVQRLYPRAGRAEFTGGGQSRGRIDLGAARRELGYEPSYTLEQGIAEVIKARLDQAMGQPAGVMQSQDL